MSRAGRSSFGCLLTLLVISAAIYFGVNIFEIYWRYYEFRDAMRTEVRFASQMSDEVIRRHLSALADSLELPDDAERISVRRARTAGGTEVRVSADYDVNVEFPGFTKVLHFTPRAEGTY